MLPEGKCRYIDGQIYPDGNFYVLDTQHIKHNGSELKSALNNISTDISNKVDKVAGKGLSTEDYTTAEKNKLSGIEANANDYVHPTTSGNKHIPSGGSSGKILGWSADGTAAWVDPIGGGGDVSSVKVGSTTYNPDSSGIVSLPAYPTTLPASDVYSWAKASSKPEYTYSEVGAASSSHTHSNYVPTTRTINGYTLSSNRTLTYSDVGAASSGHTHSTATTSNSGFMSYSDKAKLNSLTPTTLTVSSYGNFTVSSVSSYVCNGFAWLSCQAKSSAQIPARSSIRVGSMSIAASLSTYMPLNIIVDGAFTRVKGWFDTSNYKDIYINAENAIAANKALYITTCFKC